MQSSLSTPKRSTRLANTCEIFYDSYAVSGSSMAADIAGSMGDLVQQRLLKGLELRRDLEVAVLGPQAKSTSDPRNMAGAQAYAKHYSLGASGGTAPTGDGTTDVVYGASQSLSLDLLDTTMQDGWQYGAMYSLYMMASAQKRAFDLAIPAENLAENQVQIKSGDGTYVCTTVSVWKSTFGEIKFVMDPVLDQYATASWSERTILGFDERAEYRPKICWLPGRGWQSERLAKDGDYEKEQIVGECCVEFPNPRSILLVTGLAETYAS